MIVATDEATVPSLFAHTLRKDWGVGVLAAESEGKRRYLFEDGEERSFTPAFYPLLRRVDDPDEQQRAAHTRLRGVLAKRRSKESGGPTTPGEILSEQLVKLHESYPDGFSDARWSTLKNRDSLIESARKQLSASAVDALLSAKQFSKVWELLVSVLQLSDLVPTAQLKLQPAPGEPERLLALSIRELLHGSGPYYQRLDRYLATLYAAFGQHAKWELATAPSALLHPNDHVCVDLTTFRTQLKAHNVSRAVSTQPSSAAYTTFLNNVQLLATKLKERGEAPRHLFDVRDFIVFTLKPAARAQPAAAARSKATARKPSPRKEPVEDGESED